MSFLRISKYIDEYTMREIIDVEPTRGTAEQMIARLKRIFGDKPYTRGALVIELHDDNEDLTDERSVIGPEGAEWALVDFFKLPRPVWRKYTKARDE